MKKLRGTRFVELPLSGLVPGMSPSNKLYIKYVVQL